jgi:hypothetical protein
MSEVKKCEEWFFAARRGDIKGFHLLESAWQENTVESTLFLVILYFQGADPILAANPFKCFSIVPSAWSFLSTLEERILEGIEEDTVELADMDILLFLLSQFYKEGWGVLKDEKKSLSYLEASAARKYAPAINMLGNLYYFGGCNLVKNYTAAATYYQTAADDLHYIAAYYNVGLCFQNGYGRTKSISIANSYFEKAADYGFPVAVQHVWKLNLYDIKKKNAPKAIKYLNMAIEQGNEEAMCAYACLLEEGKDCELDKPLALKLFHQAVDQSVTASLLFPDVLRHVDYRSKGLAAKLLAEKYKEGNGVEKDGRKAFELYEKALTFIKHSGQYKLADASIVHEIEFKLGMSLINGIDVEQNVEKGMLMIEESALENNLEALHFVGSCYHEGKHGKPQSYKQAFSFFHQACRKKHPASMYMTAMYMLENLQNEKQYNDKDIVSWLNLAAIAGYIDAKYMMGVMTQLGRGMFASTKISFDYFRQAAEAGNVDAMYNLGMCYLEGKGVESSLNNAIAWFDKAATLGDTDAMYNLALLLIESDLAGFKKGVETEDRKDPNASEAINDSDTCKVRDRVEQLLLRASQLGDNDATEQYKIIFQ